MKANLFPLLVGKCRDVASNVNIYLLITQYVHVNFEPKFDYVYFSKSWHMVDCVRKLWYRSKAALTPITL